MATNQGKMHRYGNIDGESGVVAYAIGETFIKVKFRNRGEAYTYSYGSAGKQHVENMKVLAAAGRGLSTYISRYTHSLYEKT